MSQTFTYNPETLAWIAGFFDGEGCVRVTASAGKRRVSMTRCTVCNVVREPLEIIQEYFGGAIWIRKGNNKSSESYELTISGKGSEEFARTILPYSVVKRGELELLLEFRELVSSWGKGFRVTDTERERREEIADRISAMKSRAKLRKSRRLKSRAKLKLVS